MNAFDPTVHAVDTILQQHEARLDLEAREDRDGQQKRKQLNHRASTAEEIVSATENQHSDVPPSDGVGTHINMEV